MLSSSSDASRRKASCPSLKPAARAGPDGSCAYGPLWVKLAGLVAGIVMTLVTLVRYIALPLTGDYDAYGTAPTKVLLMCTELGLGVGVVIVLGAVCRNYRGSLRKIRTNMRISSVWDLTPSVCYKALAFAVGEKVDIVDVDLESGSGHTCGYVVAAAEERAAAAEERAAATEAAAKAAATEAAAKAAATEAAAKAAATEAAAKAAAAEKRIAEVTAAAESAAAKAAAAMDAAEKRVAEAEERATAAKDAAIAAEKHATAAEERVAAARKSAEMLVVNTKMCEKERFAAAMADAEKREKELLTRIAFLEAVLAEDSAHADVYDDHSIIQALAPSLDSVKEEEFLSDEYEWAIPAEVLLEKAVEVPCAAPAEAAEVSHAPPAKAFKAAARAKAFKAAAPAEALEAAAPVEALEAAALAKAPEAAPAEATEVARSSALFGSDSESESDEE
jgi:hypothetical protein